MTQKLMAELFDCSTDNISFHLKNIFAEGELDKRSTTEESSVVQREGDREVNRKISWYSLEAIIAVGYRVNSERGTQFRIWTTDKLKGYILKGFAIDSERFKHGTRFETRYFDELLEEIREIRASERMAYQKITDIYATNFILLLQDRPQRKSLPHAQIRINRTWDLQVGENHPKARLFPAISKLLKTTCKKRNWINLTEL